MENAEESDERWKFEEVVGEDWKQGAALLRLECLHKWDLRESCALQCFSVDHAVRRLQVPALLRHFFADEDVLSRLQVSSPPRSIPNAGPVPVCLVLHLSLGYCGGCPVVASVLVVWCPRPCCRRGDSDL